jgi:hypothetical protein
MKPLRASLVLPLVVAVSALALANGARRLRLAEGKAKAAEALLQDTRAQAREVEALRAREERVALHERPHQDVIALVSSVLADAGIPGACFKNLEQDADVALDGGSFRRQSLTLALQDVSPFKLGAFLEAWRMKQKVWTVTRIELSHPRRGADANNAYGVRLVISAIYVS